jgi:hypothetical protein
VFGIFCLESVSSGVSIWIEDQALRGFSANEIDDIARITRFATMLGVAAAYLL